jgi:hypothetical protein
LHCFVSSFSRTRFLVRDNFLASAFESIGGLLDLLFEFLLTYHFIASGSDQCAFESLAEDGVLQPFHVTTIDYRKTK